MNRKYIRHSLAIIFLLVSLSCYHSNGDEGNPKGDSKSETIVRKRDDGTLSSVNQVDDYGIVNGIRITYYADGKSLYSKTTFNHGIKEGPAHRYYNNGQIFEHTSFKDGKKHGLTRKYYKDGSILAELEYENGNVLPGLKEYFTDGTLVISYPEIKFREIDLLSSKNRIDLEMYCTDKNRGVKYFLLDQDKGITSRIYLISENSSALMQFYLNPGDTLHKMIEIIAEIPTDLGNIMVIEHTYQLTAVN